MEKKKKKPINGDERGPNESWVAKHKALNQMFRVPAGGSRGGNKTGVCQIHLTGITAVWASACRKVHFVLTS